MTATTPEPDLVLLDRFSQTGDAGAFAQIVQRYARVVYSAAIRILCDDSQAQDVSQETFFRLMQQPKLVSVSLAGWLHRTATHLSLDIRRSELARKQREKTFVRDQQNARDDSPAWGEMSALIDQALDQIQEPTRTLLIRHFLQGVPQNDLASELDVSAATISRRIKSGLDELQLHLKQKGIYVGLIVLIDFCTHQTAHAAPAAFLCELGKMQMICVFRELPVAHSPQMVVHSPFRLREIGSEYAPAKFAVVLVAVSLIVGAYAFATTVSWKHATVPATTNLDDSVQR